MRWVLFLILSYCDPFSLFHVLIKLLSYDKMIHADCGWSRRLHVRMVGYLLGMTWKCWTGVFLNFGG